MSSLIASNPLAHEDAIVSLVWTSDNLLVSGSLDELLKAWAPDNIASPVYTSSTQDMSLVSIASQNSTVISSSLDGMIRVYDFSKKSLDEYQAKEKPLCIKEIEAGPGMCWEVSIHPNSEYPLVATGTKSGGVSIFNYQTGELTASLGKSSNSFTLSTRFSYNRGGLLLTSHEDGSIQVFDTLSGACKERLSTGSSPLRCLAVSPCNHYFAVGNDEGLISLYSLLTLKQIGSFTGHIARITSMNFSYIPNQVSTASPTEGATSKSSDHELILVSTSFDRVVNVWKVKTGEKSITYSNIGQPAWSSAVSPDGTKLALGLDGGELVVYSLV